MCRFYPLTLSESSCRPGFCVEFLAEVWESMNSTSSLFQRGGVWTTVCGADLHSCILFSTWEENVHHQIACLWDIKERHLWLCVCVYVCGARNNGRGWINIFWMRNLITKKALMWSSSQLNLLSELMQNYTITAAKCDWIKKRGCLSFHFQHVWISWCKMSPRWKFDVFLLAAKSAKHVGF